MKNFSFKTRQYALTIFTVGIIAFAITTYFFIYIPRQRDNLNERNFRALSGISRNINEKLESLKQTARNYVYGSLFYGYYDDTYDYKNDSKKYGKANKHTKEQREQYSASILKYLQEHYHTYLPDVTFTELSPPNYQAANEANESNAPVPGSSGILVHDTVFFMNWEYKFAFSINLSNYVHTLLQDDVFKNLFIIKGQKVICNSCPGITLSDNDTLLNSLGGVQSSAVRDIEISGTRHKLFTLPFSLPNEEPVILCGIMPTHEYQQQVMSISSSAVLFILLGAFLLFLALPLLKFAFMSRSERMGIVDVIFSGVALVLGSAVLVLVTLDTYMYWGPGKIEQDGQLSQLSDHISSSFLTEIDSACAQLDIYDKKIDSITVDLVSIADTPAVNPQLFLDDRLRDSLEGIARRSALYPASYPYFHNVSWADSAGRQRFKWSTSKDLTNKIQTRDREYFVNTTADRTWIIPNKRRYGFTLESVFSWTTNENIAIISKKSNANLRIWYDRVYWSDTLPRVKAEVISLSSRLRSVMDPVLPIGFGFCIMDQAGKVIFHSNKQKNLKENFIEECGNSPDLLTAIHARTSALLMERYQNHDNRMLIRPVNDLPLFIVTFEDNDYNKTSNGQVLGLSLLLILAFFGFVCLQAFLLRLLKWKTTRLQSKKFLFEWLWPVSARHEAYHQAFLFQVGLALLLLIFAPLSGPLGTFLIFLLSSVFTCTFTYLKIDQQYEAEGGTRWHRFFDARNRWLVVTAFTLALLLNLLASWALAPLIFFLFEACAVLLLLAFTSPRLIFWKFSDFRRSYIAHQLSLLVITSILPAIFFFRVAYNKEQEFTIREGQLHFARELNEKSVSGKTYGITGSATSPGPETDVYAYPFHGTTIHDTAQQVPFSHYEDLFEHVAEELRPAYNHIITSNRGLMKVPADSCWHWGRTAEDQLSLSYMDLQKSPGKGVDTLVITSTLRYFQLPNPFYGGLQVRAVVFWAGLLLLLVILAALIRFIAEKVFAMNFFRASEYSDSMEELAQTPHYLERVNVFIVGTPYSGKSAWLGRTFTHGAGHAFIDLVDLSTGATLQELMDKCAPATLVIIDHFEYGNNNIDIQEKKLSLLEAVFRDKEKRILVMSAVHPLTFLEECRKLYASLRADADAKPESDRYRHDLDRWNRILGGFYKVYFPIHASAAEKAGHTGNILDRECDGNSFLVRIKPFIRASLRGTLGSPASTHIYEEGVILKIQNVARTYYNSLWLSLTSEEQYVLYDAAQDGLLNTLNRDAITLLLNKGILTYRDRFFLMNESFRNFILTEVSAEKAYRLEKDVNPDGTWKKFKTPLVLILMAIALFVFYTQQEIFNSVVASVTTFITGIPVLIKLISMFSTAHAGKPQAE
jgi:hypothetical protein